MHGASINYRYVWDVSITHKYRRSIVAFLISKSVEPNEEQKLMTSDLEQGITASTER